MRVFRRALYVCLLLALPLPVLAEPPSVSYLQPAGGQCGTTVELTASGKFAHWPPQVVAVEPGLEWKPANDAGKWQVTVAADTRPGVHWVRFCDEEGSSRWTPFIVGQVPELIEVEPNDRGTEAMALPGPATVHGKLAKSGDIDSYAVMLKAGETLVASVCAHEILSAPMDAILQIAWVRETTADPASPSTDAPDIFVMAHNDDERGRDPQVTFQAPRDGKYLVRIFAFPADPNSSIAYAGGDNYVYRLTITNGPFVDHVLPLAVQRSTPQVVEPVGWNLPAELRPTPQESLGDRLPLHVPDAASAAGALALNLVDVPVKLADHSNEPQPITPPVVLSGRLDPTLTRHRFVFAAKKDESLLMTVDSQSMGFTLDSVLRVVDGEGKTLAESDDRGGNPDAELTWKAPADGQYELQILDRFGSGSLRHAYQLTVVPAPGPDFALKVTKDAYVLRADQPLEIAVAVERLRGFGGEITVSVEGLPEGVVAEPVVSKNEGASAKEAKLTLRVEGLKEPFGGLIRIVGRSGETTHTARATDAPARAPAEQLWLTARK